MSFQTSSKSCFEVQILNVDIVDCWGGLLADPFLQRSICAIVSRDLTKLTKLSFSWLVGDGFLHHLQSIGGNLSFFS